MLITIKGSWHGNYMLRGYERNRNLISVHFYITFLIRYKLQVYILPYFRLILIIVDREVSKCGLGYRFS